MTRGVSRYEEALLQCRLWTPAALGQTALLVWFDASDRSTITCASGLVTVFKDKSGNGKTATPWGIGPSVARAGASHTDNHVLVFVGNDEIDFTSTTTAAAWMAFAVHKPVTMDLAIAYIMSGVSMGLAVGGTSYPNFLAFDGSNILQASGSTALNTYLLETYSPDHLYLNGTETAYASSQTVGALTLSAIGNRPANSYFYKGAFGEMLLVNTASSIIRQRVEGYLAWKWGLQARLAANHPYVSGPPLIGV